MKPKTVDEYIEEAPRDVQEKLNKIRTIIKAVVPDADEKLSYGMPYYGYKCRLVYFAYAKKHIGLYIPPPVIQDHAEVLKNYVTATATVQFPLDKNLPITLIKNLVKARVKINQEKQQK